MKMKLESIVRDEHIIVIVFEYAFRYPTLIIDKQHGSISFRHDGDYETTDSFYLQVDRQVFHLSTVNIGKIFRAIRERSTISIWC